MQEQHYRIIGWGIFFSFLGLAFYWCSNHIGLMGFFLDLEERLIGKRLIQISWLLTFGILGLPGWMIKNYFEGLAWNAHIAKLPPPDPREAAKRSKYVKVDNLSPAPPKPVTLTSIPEGQEEFIATCPACGNFFSAKKSDKNLKCPSCGEGIPLSS